MIEQNTNYAYKLKYMDNPTFDKVRDLSTKFYRELPQALQDELFEALNRGIDILDSEPQMTAYLFAYGKMHKAKLNYAFEHLPETFFEIPVINIIDYGCGQAVATMCYADFLRKQGYEQKIRRVTLIEPSEAALKRAALHVSVFFPDAEIVTINKGFDDLETKDIVCDEDVPTLHLLSNVLDLECFNLIEFKKLVKKSIGPSNLFVCVGPYFGDKDRGKHMDSFAKYFKGEEIISEDLDAYKLDEDNSWTCMVRCFGVGDLDYSISDENLSTEVTDEDIEDGIEDEFGFVYSKDRKRLLRIKKYGLKVYSIKNGTKVICDNASTLDDTIAYDERDEGFLYIPSLQSIFIPETVTSIGESAFRRCESLQSIVIPNSVTSIGEEAFSGCKSLQSIVIPNSVTSIGDSVFSECKSLKSIVIPNSVTSIGDSVFSDCKSLKSIVIPNSVTSIGDSAFSDCKSLKSIVIPNSVTSIGNHAFNCCESLQSIVIPNSVTSIGNHAFNCCESLQSIVIPNNVTSIGENAFLGCKSLQSIVIPKSVTCIGANPFVNSGVRSIVSHSKFFTVDREALYDQKKKLLIACFSKGYHFVIPNSVTNIGDDAFCGCTSLKSIVIPNSVTSIGNCAFLWCESLQSIVIPNSVTSIGESAFWDCKSLQSIVIPNSVTSIGNRAFKCCESLQSIVIPNSVTSIGGEAFRGCDSLKSISIPNSVTNIGGWAFMGCKSLQSIVIPNSVKSIGVGNRRHWFWSCAFEDCKSLRAILIPKGSGAKFKKILDKELWDKLYYLEKADVNAEDMDDDLPF